MSETLDPPMAPALAAGSPLHGARGPVEPIGQENQPPLAEGPRP